MNHLKQAISTRVIRTWLSAGLALLLTLSTFAGIASAAEDTVTNFSFYSPPSNAALYVEETYELQVNATLLSTAGATTTKDVTSDASWSSSNPAVIKVDKGILTGVSNGDATIKAQYKGSTVTIKFTSSYKYDSISLTDTNGTAVADTADVELGQAIEFGLKATKNAVDDSSSSIKTSATWTSSNTAVATISAGKVTLLAVGETTITSSYKGKSDSIKLKVASPYKTFTISPDSLMEFIVGAESKTLIASGVLNSNSTPVPSISDAKWSTGNSAVATVVGGVVTPVGPGTTQITAYHLGSSATINVVVRPAYEAMRISPKEEQHLTIKDSPIPFTLTVINSDESTVPVTDQATWTSSNVFAATVDVDKTKGTVVVSPKGVGTTTIKATYKGLTQQVNITVYPTVSTLTVASDTVDVFQNDVVTLPKVTAKTLADETVDISNLVDWTSSNTDVVALVNNKWTAKKLGSAVLKAQVTDTKFVTVTINVNQKPLVLTTDQDTMSIVVGKEAQFPTVTVTYEDGEVLDVTSKVTWKSSSANLLLKSPNMKITNMKGLVASNVTLTATYLGKSTVIRITIEEEITKLFVDAATVVLNPNKTKTLKVTGVYKSGKSVTLSSKMNWTLTPETVASINGSTIKGLAEGTAKLVGKYQEQTLQVTITVVPKLKKLTLNSKAFTMSPGAKGTIKVNAEYESGQIVDVSNTAVWTSSNENAVVVNGGSVTGIAKGSATIKATFDGKSVSVRVTIK
ncbi:hypothetical protein Back11_52260 [Paenibacillus baekrokdamisoli]|uniref:Uncharacterized protein n=1 Tax=Paenibacillus baekrokdamisoli TaxID=1712516 RepID=A0A3G9JD39_9BACL|nr:bacterial surface protein [Paenibacillus baekrokdamisoli]MBB3069063.1 hypothetical protein [Paenibacillus baekrokdamisoli]BBH23881.1 hypothetical protein Back11_52260 [Paenibacillus baekrokdamisoli]